MKSRSVKEILSDSKSEFKGDLVIEGNVERYSELIVNGSLTIQGGIHEYTKVTVNGRDSNLIVNGAVHPNAKITCEGNCEFKSRIYSSEVESKEGSIIVDDLICSSTIITKNGLIHLKDIGDSCKIISVTGDIQAENIGNHVRVKSIEGNITVGDVGYYTEIVSEIGGIQSGNIDSNSTIRTEVGNIQVGEIKHNSSVVESNSGSVSINGTIKAKTSGPVIIDNQCSAISVSTDEVPTGIESYIAGNIIANLFGGVGRSSIECRIIGEGANIGKDAVIQGNTASAYSIKIKKT